MASLEALQAVERIEAIFKEAVGGSSPRAVQEVRELCSIVLDRRTPGSYVDISERVTRLTGWAETIFSHRKWMSYETPDSPRAGWEVCRQLAMNDASVLRRIIETGVESEGEAK